MKIKIIIITLILSLIINLTATNWYSVSQILNRCLRGTGLRGIFNEEQAFNLVFDSDNDALRVYIDSLGTVTIDTLTVDYLTATHFSGSAGADSIYASDNNDTKVICAGDSVMIYADNVLIAQVNKTLFNLYKSVALHDKNINNTGDDAKGIYFNNAGDMYVRQKIVFANYASNGAYCIDLANGHTIFGHSSGKTKVCTYYIEGGNFYYNNTAGIGLNSGTGFLPKLSDSNTGFGSDAEDTWKLFAGGHQILEGEEGVGGIESKLKFLQNAEDGGFNLCRDSLIVNITASAAITAQVNIPINAKILGVQLVVHSALSAGETWNAEWNDGSTVQAIASAVAVAVNSGGSYWFNINANSNITDAETDIVIQRSSNPGVDAFTAQGSIECHVYYYTWITLDTRS